MWVVAVPLLPEPPDTISAGSGEGKEAQDYTYSRSRQREAMGQKGFGKCLTAASTSHVPSCGPLPRRYSQRNTNSLMSPHTEMYLSHWLDPEVWRCVLNMDSPLMMLLIQGTEGLFYSARKDNDNLRDIPCSNMHVWLASFFLSPSPFHWIIVYKKNTAHIGKKNWPIKRLHMFLISEMFSFNRPWGTERTRFIHTKSDDRR